MADEKLRPFDDWLGERNLRGFWKIAPPEGYREPTSSFVPCLWRWEEISEALDRAGEIIGPEDAARRFIGFCNPSLKEKGATTHTLLLGAQLIKPGEVARAHRHTMGAIRFVIRGGGAQTTIDGEPFPMERGDLVTTPNRTWHNHFNGSDKPIIWLDGADGSLMRLLEVGFSEPYGKPEQPVTKPVGASHYELGPARPSWVSSGSLQPPPYRYRWEDTERALQALGEKPGDPFDGILLRFVNPVNGGPTLPTFSCEMQMLRPGETTRAHRHTSTALYHVFSGEGWTQIGEVRFEWKTGDTFAVPLWRWHQHGCSSGREAILFGMNDKPVMDAFGFYREEQRD